MRYHVYDKNENKEYCYLTREEAVSHYERIAAGGIGRKPCQVFGCWAIQKSFHEGRGK